MTKTAGAGVSRTHTRAGASCSTYIIRLAAMVSVLAASAAWATTLSITILDETGAPCPARAYLTDSKDNTFFDPQSIQYKKLESHSGAREHHSVPVHGVLNYEIPGGIYSLTIEKGKEYLPIIESLDIPASGRVERTFHLKRWIQMARLGWFSGDMHVHALLPDVATLMQAEDLNIALPITVWHIDTAEKRDTNLSSFLEKADQNGVIQVGPDSFFTVINEELETYSSALLISRLGRAPLALDYPMAATAEKARQRGAIVNSEKATSLELPAIVAASAGDFVGVANNHFWRSGCYLGPWGSWPGLLAHHYPETCAGFANAGFDLYYALLNTGFPLKLSAGSAYGVHPVPMGWARIYAHVEGKFDVDSWFAALKKGRSFVTTGPMVLLKANGLEPGQDYKSEHFPLTVKIDLTMLSAIPIDHAEIVVNGTVQSIRMRPDRKGFTYRGSARLVLKDSSWVVARWVGKQGESTGLAHTSPIYFWKGESPIPVSRPDADYLARRIQSLIEEVKSGKSEVGAGPTTMIVDSPALKEETLRRLNQSLDYFRLEAQPAH
jgi:hypothetical protein